MNQHTLRSTYKFVGKGLHTGLPVTMTLYPAPDDYGIVFERTDLGDDSFVEARLSNVSPAQRSTCLVYRGVEVRTPEHLLAALSALGVDNALIKLDAPEVPILDGSAAPYAEAILADGLEDQKSERKYITVSETCEYHDTQSGTRIVVEPADIFEVCLLIDFGSKVLGVQRASYREGDDFASEIATCRTFCFYDEIKPLLDRGLIKGGDLDNALVIDEPRGYLNGPVLRFENECARHKLLDLLGDFSLLGSPMKVKITAEKPGHAANAAAARTLLPYIV
jgi:UDP-3-0-acyl N-acetylglucosamine deacetylase